MNILTLIICIPLFVLLILNIVLSDWSSKRTINLERLEHKVQQKLTNEGIGWKKEDGEMYIIKKGVRFDTYFHNAEGRPSARVFFVYRLEDEELKPINGFGQLILADQMNSNHVGITTVVHNDCLQSFYYADVRNAKECVFEFNHAYDRFAEMMQDYAQLKPRVLQDFPVEPAPEEKRTIGFN